MKVEYAGGTSVLKSKKKIERAYEVRFSSGGRYLSVANIRESKCFSFSVYGNKELALLAAETYRRKRSCELDRTVYYYPTRISIQQRKYIAGLMDGDGCIRHTGSTISVSIRQSQNDGQPAVIAMLQKLYGGNVVHREAHGNFRKQHCLELGGYNCLPVLYDIMPYLVLKPQQARIAYNFLMADSPFTERENVFATLRDMKLMDAYQAVPVSVSQLSDPYLSGFFDAEGCVVPHDEAGIAIEFSQAQSDQLLVAINEYFGGRGCVKTTITAFTGDNGYKVAVCITPYSIVKRSQLEAAIQLRSICVKHWRLRTDAEREKAVRLREFITSEKHK